MKSAIEAAGGAGKTRFLGIMSFSLVPEHRGTFRKDLPADAIGMLWARA
jgi:hypothetical protein